MDKTTASLCTHIKQFFLTSRYAKENQITENDLKKSKACINVRDTIYLENYSPPGIDDYDVIGKELEVNCGNGINFRMNVFKYDPNISKNVEFYLNDTAKQQILPFKIFSFQIPNEFHKSSYPLYLRNKYFF